MGKPTKASNGPSKKGPSAGGASAAPPLALGDIEAMLNSALKKKAIVSKELIEEMEANEKSEQQRPVTAKGVKKVKSKQVAKVVVTPTEKAGKKSGPLASKKTQQQTPVATEAVAEPERDNSEEEEEDVEEESNTAIIQRAILGLTPREAREQRKAHGGSGGFLGEEKVAAAYKAAMLEDPLAATLGFSDYALHTLSTSAATGGVGAKRSREESDAFVASIARQKGDAEYVAQDELLDSAHEYFTQINKEEKRRNRMAMARIQEMKRINDAGGDKDGFKFILPKSVKTFARTMNVKGMPRREPNVDYSGVDPDELQSQFLTKADPGTSIGAEADRELLQNARKNKKKEVMLDDFYQHQRAKKWAKNAENFLLKGRANKNMFMKRQQSQRSAKNL